VVDVLVRVIVLMGIVGLFFVDVAYERRAYARWGSMRARDRSQPDAP
jgi:hypothetical protein